MLSEERIYQSILADSGTDRSGHVPNSIIDFVQY